MSKLSIFLILVLVSAVVLFAADTPPAPVLGPPVPKTANSERIAELDKQLQQVVSEIQQAQAFIDAKKTEGLKIQGAIEELQRQDKAAEKPKVGPPSPTPEKK
ncbi:MAG TPA: hypothetical protein DCS05_09320 [Nitrospiraceae bacterium]|nr:hypothetical protein [Nitrospiraceae bacterium]